MCDELTLVPLDGTETHTTTPPLSRPVSRTVDELRDDIRQAVGRYERVESTAFTKEALASLCSAVGHDIDTSTSGRLPPKAEMRAGILQAVGELEEADVGGVDRPFRKAELQAIHDALRGE